MTMPAAPPDRTMPRLICRNVPWLVALTLLACGGSSNDGGGGKSAPTYAVGGTLSGLASGTLVLGSGIDSVQINVTNGVVQDRPFQLAALPSGAAYSVRIDQQPVDASCTVLNGSSTVGTASVTNIRVQCVRIKSPALVAGALPTFGAQDGLGTRAGFSSLRGVVADAAGNLYATDANAIRKISPRGTVTTLAGISAVPGYVDAAGVAARFNSPQGITVDPAGNVLVADGNDEVRRVTPAGVVTTVAKRADQRAALKAQGFLILDRVAFDFNMLKRLDTAGNVTTLQNLRGFVTSLAGDGRGNVLKDADLSEAGEGNGVFLLFFSDFRGSARLIDVGTRALVGPLPTTVQRPTAMMFANGRVYLAIGASVHSFEL